MFSDLGKRRDETGDAHETSISKQFGHLSNAPDVLLAILSRKAQILVQAMTNVVSIQRVARDGVGHKILFQSKTDGCLPCARQA